MGLVRRIYFETNYLSGRWPAHLSGDLQILARLARLADVQLCVPESAVIEHKYSTIRRVLDHLKISAKQIGNANELLNGITPDVQLPIFDVATAEAAHDAAVEAVKQTHGFVVVSGTTKSVNDFVRYAASHAPPFKAKDEGFRDAVHLHSALDHLTAAPLQVGEEAAFVTADKYFAGSASNIAASAGMRFVNEARDAIELVMPQLASTTSELLIRLGNEWAPEVTRYTGENLLERLAEAIVVADVHTDKHLWAFGDLEVSWLVGDEAVAPTDESEPHRIYEMWLPVSLKGNALWGSSVQEIPAGVKRINSVGTGSVEARINIDAEIETDETFQVRNIRHQAAHLEWIAIDGGERMDTGSPPIDLLSL